MKASKGKQLLFHISNLIFAIFFCSQSFTQAATHSYMGMKLFKQTYKFQTIKALILLLHHKIRLPNRKRNFINLSNKSCFAWNFPFLNLIQMIPEMAILHCFVPCSVQQQIKLKSLNNQPSINQLNIDISINSNCFNF